MLTTASICLCLLLFPVTNNTELGGTPRVAPSNQVSEYEIPKDAIRTIGSTSSAAMVNVDFLNKTLENVDIVGLGECSHYTRECYIAKQAVILELAKSADFNVLLLEVDFGQALKWNDYVVNGVGDLDQLIADTGWFTYRTAEFRDFLAAIRNHNQTANRKLHLCGMEMTYVKDNFAWLQNYIQKHGPEDDGIIKLLSAERKHLAFQRHSPEEVLEYWQLYFRITEFLSQHKNTLTNSSNSHEFEIANRIAEIFRQYATYVSQSDSRLQVELRDKFSTRNVLWAMSRQPDSKAIIWAHNGHIRRTYSYDALGRSLSLLFDDRYYAIGFKFGEGQFGSHNNDWNFKSFSYPKAAIPQLEGHLNRFETDLFIDIRARASQKRDINDFANRSITTWQSFGERVTEEQATTQMVLKDTYDGLLFLRRTKSATPFEKKTP